MIKKLSNFLAQKKNGQSYKNSFIHYDVQLEKVSERWERWKLLVICASPRYCKGCIF